LVKVAVAAVVVVEEELVVVETSKAATEISKVAVEVPRAVVEAYRVAVVVTKAVGETESPVSRISPAMISHVGLTTAPTANSSTRFPLGRDV
jgi:hypothetical protein